jgi:YVTN family beta-propeller protein
MWKSAGLKSNSLCTSGKSTFSTIVLVFTILFSVFVSTPLIQAQTVTNTITVGDGPFGLGVNTSTNKIYVANNAANTVSVIDGSSNTVTATINVGSGPQGVGVNTSTNKIYVANAAANTVSVISGSSDSVSSTVNVGSVPQFIGVNTETNKIYVGNRNGDSVSVIDGSSDSVSTTITVGDGPFGVGVNTSTNKIYVANFFADTVSVIDGSTDTVSTTINVGDGPYGVDVNTSTNKIYISNENADTVSVIDGSSNTVTATITVGDGPRGVDTHPTTNKIYVVNNAADTVSVIDGSTNTVSTTVTVGDQPVGVGVNTSTDKIYVANFNSDSVSVISDPRPTTATSSGGGPKGDVYAPTFSLDKFTFSRLFPENVVKTVQDNPLIPIEPINDETLALPLAINENGYAISNHANTIKTNTIQTGTPTIIKLNLSDETGIEHIVLYTNLRGEKREIADSDTYIVYDEYKELEVVDPHGLFYFANVTVHKNNTKYLVSYNVTFAKPMEKSDIIFRIWDDRRNAADTKIFAAWEIGGEEITKNEQFSLLLADPAVKGAESSEFALYDKEAAVIMDKWAGYYAESASDASMLKAIGLEGSHIPHWVKKFFGENIYQGDLNMDDFVEAIKYLSKVGIVK